MKAPLIIGVSLLVATLVAISHSPQEKLDCPEDAVLVWSGQTNAHTLCLTLDDLVMAEAK